jgi:regulator of sigma E protease
MIEMPSFFWMIVFFVIAIFPLVVLHELGHYGVGRLFGIHAEVFSIGFGKRLFGWRDRKGTQWQVAAIPLGGYVKFAGDMSAAGQTDPEWLNLPPEQRNRTFQSKPLWQRALVVLAGPVANFIVAMAILAGVFAAYGEPRIAPEVGIVAEKSAAQAAGLRTGDRIVGIDGETIDRFDQVGMIVQVRAGQPTLFVVERGGTRQTITVTPRRELVKDITGVEVPMGRIGIGPARIERVKLSATEIPGAAARFTVQSVQTMARALGQIVMGQRSVQELGGPVKMAATSEKIAALGFVSFLFFMAMVSINLGFINLLPIPTLDGGHLAFYAVEAVQRKPVGLETQEWAYRSGLFVLLAFMLFVTVNDLAGLGLFRGLAG